VWGNRGLGESVLKSRLRNMPDRSSHMIASFATAYTWSLFVPTARMKHNFPPELNDNESNSSDFANLNWTHTFSPHLLNQAGASLIRPFGSDLPVDLMAILYAP
jgi:hypothetical protein